MRSPTRYNIYTICTVIFVFMMIRSQNSVVTSKHVELPFTTSNFVISLFRFVERGKNVLLSLIRRSVLQTFFYFHLLYNVCYHSMAKTEDSQDCGRTENALTKSPQGSENFNLSLETVPAAGECASRTSCSHLKTAVNFNHIRKAVQQNSGNSFSHCVSCKANVAEVDGEKSGNFMLCMKCGECCCPDHAVRHYQTARSDPHLVYADTDDWNVKCFECDCNISSEGSGQLGQVILYLKNKKKSIIENPKPGASRTSLATESIPSAAFANPDKDSHKVLAIMISGKPTSPSSSLPPPRGLSNLGNTCFFNSVLQCLARTPFLVETLLEMKEPGERVVMKLEPHPPIDVELQERWGSVTETLVSTMIQITASTGGVFTPAHLLDALRSKHRQFMGYNQHDAHELLRTLLDCVKNEDLRRYRVELLRHLGLSRKTNPEDVDEKKKALAKEMDKKLTEIVNVRPDPVFRGFTVSANTCIKCGHKSEIPESFLDLSLPVCFFKLQPLSVNRRKNDFVSDKPSKHQLKKERLQASKNKKMVKRNKRLAAAEAQKHRNSEKRSTDVKDVSESGYSSGKAPSPVQGTYDVTQNESNDEILAEALNEINSTPVKNLNEVKSSANSFSAQTPGDDVNHVDISSVDVKNNVDPDEQVIYNDGASTTSSLLPNIEQTDSESASCSGPTLTAVVSSPSDSSSSYRLINSLSNNLPEASNSVGNGSSSSAGEEDDDLDAENEGENDDADESDERDDCVDDNVLVAQSLGMTLQPPTSDDEENSILACLREYTKCEVLTGNNKVVCEKCTKEANKNSSEKKQIYRNFTKQLLIKCPPPVLILHLKRFEARGAFSFRKVDTNIAFPLTLDVGSFCSATCEKLLYPNQKNILYSLYGIVEHSGSLNAGHYVAYVKVRNTTKHSYRRQFLPKNVRDHLEPLSDKDLEEMKSDLRQEERQWYYISDSTVRTIGEEDVLRKQAYLLFYERIW